MVRIRFHGRGGHGIKTASRIVGTAAFLAGHHVQDSPIYGAERRGAAVTAYTRISSQPTLERGAIQAPDLIILADETLLEDTAAGVLTGQEVASGMFINTKDPQHLIEKYRIKTRVEHFDLTGRTLKVLGRASALSSGLAAAGAALCGGITPSQLAQALTDEFRQLQLGEDIIEKNKQVASEVLAALSAVDIRQEQQTTVDTVTTMRYEGPLRGTPSVLEPGTAIARHTGSWRVQRPIIDHNICTRCGLCVVRCPDGAIALDEDGYPVIDYDHCKGCMICRHECPVLGSIKEQMETQAW